MLLRPPFALIVSSFLPLALLLACAPPASEPRPAASEQTADSAARAADRAALLRLHEQARRAHFEDRADLLVASHADSVFSLSRGEVSVSRPADARTMFQEYFDQVTFQMWDDVVPPRIRISPDGQMAYVVVEKRVHLTAPGRNGATQAERVRYAWLSVYEKVGGQWRLSAIASTERPDSA